METTKTSEPVDMKLEVVVIGVSDVDRREDVLRKARLASRRRLREGRFPRYSVNTTQFRSARSSSARE